MTATHPAHGHSRSTAKRGWATGMMVFAAVMLMITGILAVMRGIAAIAEDDVFVTTRNYVFAFDLTGWGWIHLILGVVAVLVGMGLFQGSGWARVVGVGVAGLVIIANFASLPAYPVWSVVMIAMSAFIIWALCTPRKGDA
jgi:hypothetical protein